jgi:pantoate--beta-alanine ligase
MGALHEGHAALIRRAREIAGATADPVVVSIFVNPTQFAPGEDYERYPRQLDQDSVICERNGASIVFAPSASEIYPNGIDTVAEGFVMPQLPSVATQPKLEDAVRPTHFAGVSKVVARLFDIVHPSQAVFGEKDYQQLRVIDEMVERSSGRWPNLRVVPHPTMREADGLAMSSRNAYLSAVDRKRAGALWRAIQAGKREKTPRQAEDVMHAILQDEEGFDVDYAVVRNARTLLAVSDYQQPCRALVAARLDNVRLIDNMPIGTIQPT